MPDREHDRHLSIKLAILVLTGVGLLAAAGCGGSMGSDPSASRSGSPGATAPPSGSTGAPPAAIATDGSLNATMGAAQTGTLTGHGTGTLTYVISVPPQGGTASLTNAATGAFSYTSYPNFTGSDSFQFTVKNGADTSQPATETIHVFSGALGAEQAVANIGVSTDWVCYWCAAQPYVDVLHQTAYFYDPANNNTPLIKEGKLDSNGWPEEDFKVFVLSGNTTADNSKNDPGTQPTLAGNYQLSFNGKATVKDAGYGTVTNLVYAPMTNITTATVEITQSSTGGSI